MLQQLTVSVGVVLGASLVTVDSWWHGGDVIKLQAQDFLPVFAVIGRLTLLSLISFVKLHPNEGVELR